MDAVFNNSIGHSFLPSAPGARADQANHAELLTNKYFCFTAVPSADKNSRKALSWSLRVWVAFVLFPRKYSFQSAWTKAALVWREILTESEKNPPKTRVDLERRKG
ncbi:hypothetical protein PoB_003439100 [Plakobranchus ocellatus]|uniref:Uncharacterized protein n=1 Tax=Plakobranchus ocellatus TaxID=259542 RepID=A0AAV4A9M8_9GAST|nr:hypothetical protein PoB_003439100 [Plakobranchus ocellatus]